MKTERGACWRRRATVVGLAVVLGACAPSGPADRREGVDVVAEGADWWVGIAPGPELQWEVRGPDATHGGGVSQYADPPTLTEAHAIPVSAGPGHVAIVVGPVLDRANEVVVTAQNGAEHAAVLFEAEGWQWFFAEVPQAEGPLRLEARDAEGELIDRGELQLGPDTDGPAPVP